MSAISRDGGFATPHCSDCGRPCSVLMATSSDLRFCRQCIDWTIAERMARSRHAGNGSSYQSTARNAGDADRKIGERFK